MISLLDVLRQIVPLPRRNGTVNPAEIFARYEQAVQQIAAANPAAATDPKLLEAAWKLFDQDGARRASIDSRAGGMMAAISLAATLVTGVAFTSFRDTTTLPAAAMWTMAATVTVALAFLLATGIGLFGIQGAVVRNTVDPTDLAAADPGGAPRALAVRVLNYTIGNYKVNNVVAERLFSAQKCFRNALFMLVAGGLATAAEMVFGSAPPPALPLAQTLAMQAGCADRATLVQLPKGGWSGKCARAGAVANVRVSPLGQVTFP